MELIFATMLIMFLSGGSLFFIFLISEVEISGTWSFLIGGVIGLSFMIGYTIGTDDAKQESTILSMSIENNGQDTLLKSKTQYLEIYDGTLYDINNDLRIGPAKVLRNSIVVGSDTIQYTKERN